MLIGCTTHIQVYDFDTKEPIADAFVYINEYKMFNPFNSSNIYLTDKDGRVYISEILRDGQVSMYIGKAGYGLNVFSRDFEGKENVKGQVYWSQRKGERIRRRKEVHGARGRTRCFARNGIRLIFC